MIARGADWIDEARRYYKSDAGKEAFRAWQEARATRPTPQVWTPERIIETQRELIERLQARLKSAEKMVDALRRYGGRLQWLLNAAIEALNEQDSDAPEHPPTGRIPGGGRMGDAGSMDAAPSRGSSPGERSTDVGREPEAVASGQEREEGDRGHGNRRARNSIAEPTSSGPR